MRTFTSIILIFLLIPLFLIGILTAIVKFEFLDPGYWEAAFEKSNVYSSLTTAFKQSVIDQTVKEGGKPSEVTSITSLITVPNVKDFVDKNLENILNFANDKVPQLLVYVPLSRFPKGFLPKNFENLPENLTLTSLLSRLNIMGITETQINYISLLGKGSMILLAVDAAFFILFTLLLFVLTLPGRSFLGPGISFILNGFAAFAVFVYGNQLASGLKLLTAKTDTSQIALGNVAPPLILGQMNIWLYAGVASIILGIALFFVKKGVPQG